MGKKKDDLQYEHGFLRGSKMVLVQLGLPAKEVPFKSQEGASKQ